MVENLRKFQLDREQTDRSNRADLYDNHLEYMLNNDGSNRQIDVQQDKVNIKAHQRAVKIVFKHQSSQI